ncbi:MAG: CBS domain-containing protein [Phycisphaerae bacterium]|nr:CBS domain-containing protein [Phycisphaerae bacterium]MBM91712.1 CBS domain-containing protein [Phycisphaerae bacterium]HCT45128.1 CBS domain-containing protein [Phycisphaerales bacterium]
MHTVSQLLEAKPFKIVYTVGQGRSVLEAAEHMNQHRIGALIVTDTLGHIAGIITERDIMTRVVTQRLDPADTAVQRVMTVDLITCSPETPLEHAREIMTKRMIRHIPITNPGDNTTLHGLISIGDLNAATNKDLTIEVVSLREYITQG